VLALVLLPQERQGDVLAAELEVDRAPIRERPGGSLVLSLDEEGLLQRRVVEVLGERPGESRNLGPPHVVGDGGGCELESPGDLPPGETEVLEPENFSYLPHGQPFCWHGHLPFWCPVE
jgi:hypothetical protein